VQITAYCLRGTTRRGRYVRSGIVAADPRYFPLARYIELYAGREYLGRFLVDDTGLKIRGPIIDVWMPSCSDARVFGRQRGTAVLVARPSPRVVQAGGPAPSGR
jgi:3D (Asp-Asp-Asp) domain-containing protein